MFVFVAGIRRHYHVSSDCFENPQKSLLISSLPEKILAKVSYPKNLGIENSNKKILPSSLSLDIWSTPPGCIVII